MEARSQGALKRKVDQQVTRQRAGAPFKPPLPVLEWVSHSVRRRNNPVPELVLR